MKTKICTECKQEQSVTEFYWQKDRATRMSQCKTCRKKYLPIPKKKNEIEELRRKYQTENATKLRTWKKAKAIELLGNCCTKCKNHFPLYIYDFHHKDPTTKDVSPAKIFCRSWEKIEKDLINFTLLCANCHRETHHKKDTS